LLDLASTFGHRLNHVLAAVRICSGFFTLYHVPKVQNLQWTKVGRVWSTLPSELTQRDSNP
jgi:hypothetical protein